MTSSGSIGSFDLKDRSFLRNARAQLDADHFGLEKIKKRLIEYLAVVRLKELNLEKEKIKDEELLTAAPQQQESPKADGTVEGKELVLYDKDKSQSPPKLRPASGPVVPRRAKGVRGPILLCVSTFLSVLHG